MQPKIRAAKRIDPATAPKTHRIDVDIDDVRCCAAAVVTTQLPCALLTLQGVNTTSCAGGLWRRVGRRW